jgi:hypothetical protein
MTGKDYPHWEEIGDFFLGPPGNEDAALWGEISYMCLRNDTGAGRAGWGEVTLQLCVCVCVCAGVGILGTTPQPG